MRHGRFFFGSARIWFLLALATPSHAPSLPRRLAPGARCQQHAAAQHGVWTVHVFWLYVVKEMGQKRVLWKVMPKKGHRHPRVKVKKYKTKERGCSGLEEVYIHEKVKVASVSFHQTWSLWVTTVKMLL